MFSQRLSRLVVLTFAAVCVGVTPAAFGVSVIDTFSAGFARDFVMGPGSKTQTQTGLGQADVVGGTRRITVATTSDSTGFGFLNYTVGGSGYAGLGTASIGTYKGQWTFQYGFDAAGNPFDLNADLTEGGANNGILLDLTADQEYSYSMTVWDGDSFSTVVGNHVKNPDPHSIFLDFNNFVGIDFSDVAGFQVDFLGTENGDYNLRYLAAASNSVPEPLTVTAVCSAVAGLGVYLRKRVVKA